MLRGTTLLSGYTRILRLRSGRAQVFCSRSFRGGPKPTSTSRIPLFALTGLSASLSLGLLTHGSLTGLSTASDEEEPLSSLVRTYVVYTICSFPFLVQSSPTILSILGSIPGVNMISEWVVRRTFFDQVRNCSNVFHMCLRMISLWVARRPIQLCPSYPKTGSSVKDLFLDTLSRLTKPREERRRGARMSRR